MLLQEVLESVRSSPEPSDEESAKFKIIAPILASLGWDPFGPQVLLEHSVSDQRASGRVDFALEGSRGIVALIEAKSPGTDLSRNVGQVLGYAFHEGVDICALTTGLEWWLYLPRDYGKPTERRFAVLRIKEDPIERSADDLEAFLSRRALETMAGNVSLAEAQAKRVLEAQRQATLLSAKMPAIWSRMITEADKELLELVTKRVYEELNLRPDQQQVAAVLRSQPVTATPLRSTGTTTVATFNAGDNAIHPAAGSQSDQTSDRERVPARRQKRVKRPVPKFRLFGTHYTIKYHSQGLVIVAEVLLERDPDDFGKLLALGSKSRPHMSLDAKDLTSPKQVGASGIFVDTNLNSQQLWERARLFLRHLGYTESDLVLEYD